MTAIVIRCKLINGFMQIRAQNKYQKKSNRRVGEERQAEKEEDI